MMKFLIKDTLESDLILSSCQVKLNLIYSCPLYEVVFILLEVLLLYFANPKAFSHESTNLLLVSMEKSI